MSVVNLPKANVPIGHGTISIPGKGNVEIDVLIDQEWMRGLSQLLDRTGGTTSNTIPDINISAFEDAGIAEQQAEMYSIESNFGQLPAVQVVQAENNFSDHGISELRARVAVLETMIAGLMQGTSP
jgi:hypothetical protein